MTKRVMTDESQVIYKCSGFIMAASEYPIISVSKISNFKWDGVWNLLLDSKCESKTMHMGSEPLDMKLDPCLLQPKDPDARQLH